MKWHYPRKDFFAIVNRVLGHLILAHYLLNVKNVNGKPEKTVFSPPLDNGIAKAVHVLVNAGIETFESCQGGRGHAYLEPTVRFYGDNHEGLRALHIALKAGLKVSELRRTHPIIEGNPTGPWWELTFVPTKV